MTTANTQVNTATAPGRFRLPDPPERDPDEKMTSFDHLHKIGNAYHLALHFGRPETTLVAADRWIVATPGSFRELSRYPDLLVAFDVDPQRYEADNGYVISHQGKPPDFVLEIASLGTAAVDVGPKRDDYAALGIPEYWRFDATGEHHGARLTGDRLVDGRYQPVEIREPEAGVLQGYSAALNLHLRCERGELAWHDPATGSHIATFLSERERADQEREARLRERADRIRAEERTRELEAELRRLRDD